MQRFARQLALTLCACAAAAVAERPAEAQADILLQLRSGSPAGDRFYVDSAGGFVALGWLGVGPHMNLGSGLRTQWYPWRGCFRSGHAIGNEWDHDNCGFYTFAGGYGSRARGIYGIAWGNQNVADAQSSVALGQSNVVHGTSPDFATGGVALGISNQVFNLGGVALGYEARSGRTGGAAGSNGSGAVAIGRRVTALRNHSVALGVRAVSEHAGAFVWGSTTTTGAMPSDSIRSTATGQFSIRAVGGIRMFTNQAMSTGVFVSANSSTWSSVSDRNRKENFAAVDGEDVLRRLRNVPVTTWTFTGVDEPERNIGPMAQDWHAAFGLKSDSLLIDRGDIDGVSLAAIQALDARTAPHAERIRELEAEVERLRALEARYERQDAEIAELREMVRRLAEGSTP